MKITTAACLLSLATAGHAHAGCQDDLKTLDDRVHAEATKAIATSSGGEAVAAKRSGEAIAARDAHRPVETGQSGPAGGTNEKQTTAQAAEAGGAGDRVMQAKAAVNDAHVAMSKGDEAGCVAAVTKAKAQLDK